MKKNDDDDMIDLEKLLSDFSSDDEHGGQKSAGEDDAREAAAGDDDEPVDLADLLGGGDDDDTPGSVTDDSSGRNGGYEDLLSHFAADEEPDEDVAAPDDGTSEEAPTAVGLTSIDEQASDDDELDYSSILSRLDDDEPDEAAAASASDQVAREGGQPDADTTDDILEGMLASFDADEDDTAVAWADTPTMTGIAAESTGGNDDDVAELPSLDDDDAELPSLDDDIMQKLGDDLFLQDEEEQLADASEGIVESVEGTDDVLPEETGTMELLIPDDLFEDDDIVATASDDEPVREEADFLGLGGIGGKGAKSNQASGIEVLFEGVEMTFDDQLDHVTRAEVLLAQGKRDEAVKELEYVAAEKGMTHWVRERLALLGSKAAREPTAAQ